MLFKKWWNLGPSQKRATEKQKLKKRRIGDGEGYAREHLNSKKEGAENLG